MDTRIVRHPALPSVTHTVPAEQVDEWLSQGWLPLLDEDQERRYQELQAEVAAVVVERPAGNASLEDWQRYAIGQYWTPEDLEGKGRDDIRDSFPE